MITQRHRIPVLLLLLPVLVVMMAAAAGTVFAEGPRPQAGQDSCVSCHENLYLLHDTGKWFCLREAPMGCVDCHGGDPASLVKEQAHAGRSAHPVFNEDSTRCLQCHPEERSERVQIFRRVAGIQKVIVQPDYVPVGSIQQAAAEQAETAENQDWQQAILWLVGAGLILALIAGYRCANKARQ